MNKKGFIATSLIFAFFLLFVAIMLSILVNFAHSRVLSNKTNGELVTYLERTVINEIAP